MLTIRTCKDHGHALGEYLRQADYYTQGLSVEGICYGQLCDDLGLKIGQPINDQEFAALAENAHPSTKKQLTERMASGRRAGYDAVFSAPKSVSIQAFIGDDSRLLTAHERAVMVALGELERHACHQKGQGINKSHLRSGKIAAAVFRHGESRELDPQLHSHAFTFNVTRDARGRMVALEAGDIFARSKYLTEVYRNTLADEILNLGYEIKKGRNGFELAGVSPELIKRFSKRSLDRDAAVATRKKELGRDLTHNEIATLVRESRKKKLAAVAPQEVRKRQLAQLDHKELESLQKLRKSASAPAARKEPALRGLVEEAKAHVFERQAVVFDYDLLAETLRAGYGQHSLISVKGAIAHGMHGLLVANGLVSTMETIEHERALIAMVNGGIGARQTLGIMPPAEQLNNEQFRAVQKILESKDTVQVLRGKAGTGKTTALAQVVKGCKIDVACFAPTSKSVEVLRQTAASELGSSRGTASPAFAGAETVQRLLVSPSMQSSVAGKLLIVDEYGLLSSRELKSLIHLVDSTNGRLLLVGDAAQHTSVEASSAARLLEKESRVSIAEIAGIRRQASNREYLWAARALAAGNFKRALSILDKDGAIIEIKDVNQRRSAMVNEWFESLHGGKGSSRKGKTALMVAPTWNEIDALNVTARERLRIGGIIRGNDISVDSLWRTDWTKAQHKDVRNYEPGQILVAHKATKHLERNAELRFVRRDGDRLLVEDQFGRMSSISPRQSGTAWTVCDIRPITLAKGDQIRLRANARIRMKDGRIRSVSNGSILCVNGVSADGYIRTADGSTLLGREFVHAYATTSYASQGQTADSVFMADPVSREGLYVSATRGREKIRIFTADKKILVEASRLHSEERMSAIEFGRQSTGVDGRQEQSRQSGTVHDLRTSWANGIGRGRSFLQLCLQRLRPWWALQAGTQAQSNQHRVRAL